VSRGPYESFHSPRGAIFEHTRKRQECSIVGHQNGRLIELIRIYSVPLSNNLLHAVCEFPRGSCPKLFVDNTDARTTSTRRILRVSRDLNPSPKAEFEYFVTSGRRVESWLDMSITPALRASARAAYRDLLRASFITFSGMQTFSCQEIHT